MTVSILHILATLPSGETGTPLKLSELGTYLGRYCNREEDKERNARHVVRDVLYRDGGVEIVKKVIDEVFEHDTIRERRKKWATYARFNNALKRIVNELSTVYAEPATRTVANDNEKYTTLLEELQIDEHSQEWNRLYNLHKAVLVGFRVRILPDGSREPTLDIVTPATWRVVLHPNDSKLVIGHLVKCDIRSARTPLRAPEWVLWTDHERVHLDKDMVPLEETYVEHRLGVCPYVPLCRSVAVPGFWPGEEGEDLVAGQVAIMVANILLMKETKSATKIPIVAGDGAESARRQPADTDGGISVSAGTAVQVVDVSMDPDLFTKVADHIMDGLAHNHGMGSAQMRHEGVQSGEARELMRVPIRELRRQQLPAFRLFERRLARVMAAILVVDDGERAFANDGWKIDFGEEQTPMTQLERLAVHEKRRQLGFDNPTDFMRRENPDLRNDEEAFAVITRNVQETTFFFLLLRTLQSLGAAPNTAADQQQNNIPGQAQRAPADANDQQTRQAA